MDDDEPSSDRKCSPSLPVVGENVRSIKSFTTYRGQLPAGFEGVVDKEMNL